MNILAILIETNGAFWGAILRAAAVGTLVTIFLMLIKKND